jgi:DNA-binding beta-propeller fold protein YncE
MKTLTFRSVVLSGILAFGACASFANDYKFERAFGKPPAVGEPRGLSVDHAGNIYVTDRGNGRILCITPQGQMRTVLHSTYPVEHPAAIALDAESRMYIVDEAQLGVHAASAEDRKVTAVVPPGPAGQWKNAPAGVVVDAQGNLYVSDQMANQVQKFDKSGKLLLTIGKKGPEPGALMGPRGLSLDAEGNLYVADEFNNRIQKFSPSGELLAYSDEKALGSTIKGGMGPMSVAVDSKGNMWVAAHTNFAVYKLNTKFNIVVHLESFGRRDGELAGPIAVAVDASDNAYVLDNTRRIQKFSPEGNFLWKYAFPAAQLGELSAPTGVAADPSGNVYVADTANFRVQKFDRSGKATLAFGRFGQGDGECNGCESVAIDRYGKLFVADHYNHRVEKFDGNGKFLMKFGKFGSGQGEFIRTKVVATDPAQDYVYVNDWTNNRIQKFDLDGNFVAAIGDSGPSKWRPMGPTGLAIDKEGSIYASSWYNNVVQKYDSRGEHVLSIGGPGSADGQFSGPARLAIDNDGNLVAVDWGNARVQVFDKQGNFLGKFGSLGSAVGEFNQPVGVAVGADGRVYVGDASNARVQAFVRTDNQAVSKLRAAQKELRATPALTSSAGGPSKSFLLVAIYDIADGKQVPFESALQESIGNVTTDKRFINERVLRNIDGLTLQYATYTKVGSSELAKSLWNARSAAVRAFCRREPEWHIAEVTSAYAPDGITKRPSGLEFGVGKTGQIAHLGLFIPFPSYRQQYQGVLEETKELTRAKKPRGYIGEDVANELGVVEPALQAPYSPRPSEPSVMSINYGEYETMEDAEDSYISRQENHDPKLVTMERMFFSALQVPTRFYIFQVIANLGGGAKSPAGLRVASLTGK